MQSGFLLILAIEHDRAHFATLGIQRVLIQTRRAQQITRFAAHDLSSTEMNRLMLLRDGRQVQMPIGSAFEQVARRIHLVQPLRNHDDAPLGRVVKARQQGSLNELLRLDQFSFGTQSPELTLKRLVSVTLALDWVEQEFPFDF